MDLEILAQSGVVLRASSRRAAASSAYLFYIQQVSIQSLAVINVTAFEGERLMFLPAQRSALAPIYTERVRGAARGRVTSANQS